ncbi:MAG: B12-binding domain-containing radical SAM protein [Desulfamplus sp.]|nr:B12-binding domain-containing radical SAM protein [Desulfamplus sp.]
MLLIWPEGMDGIFPLSMGYLMNVLKKIDGKQIESSFLDCSLTAMDTEQFIGSIKEFDYIGISIWGSNLDNVNRYIDLIRQNSDAIIISGGPSAHLVDADFSIIGEGESSLKAFLLNFNRIDTDFVSTIQGVRIKGNEIRYPSDFIDDLDSLGYIDYDLLQLDRYLDNGYKDWMYSIKDKFRSAPIMTTRGCPYSCAYCQGPVVMGHNIRKHSIEYVINTIQTLYEKHNIRQISILDDNLTFYIDYAKQLCEAIVKFREKHQEPFLLTTINGVRVNRLDEELIILMKKAGWAEVVISPESGSPKTLKLMKKSINIADMEQKMELIHKHRMNVVGYFMCAYPGETKKDLEMTRDYILNSKFDRCILNFFNPTPGTPVYAELIKNGALRQVNNNINYKAINYIPEDLTEHDLIEFKGSITEKTRFKEKWIKDL